MTIRSRAIFLLLALLLSLGSVAARPAPPAAPSSSLAPEPDPFSGRYPAEVALAGPADLTLLYDLGIDIDAVWPSEEGAYPADPTVAVPLRARVYVDAGAALRLEAVGLHAEPVPNEGLRAFQAYGPGKDTPLAWPTFEQMVARMQALVAAHPDIMRLVSIGKSVQNRDLWCMEITDYPDVEEAEPEVKYTSTMHGDETTGVEMTLRLAELLANSYGVDPDLTELVDSLEIWLCPIHNPDGYVAGSRSNANGVDLNRDFPDPVADPVDDPAGRAVETQAFMALGYDHRFAMGANYHGGAQVVNYPWDCRDDLSPDDAEYYDFSVGYAIRNPIIWEDGTPASVVRGARWYIVYGGIQDWSYNWRGEHHVTIELSKIKSPPYTQMDTYWEANREAMLWWMQRPLRNGARGRVTDANTGAPLDAVITVAPERMPVTTDPDAGDYSKVLLDGAYTLTASAYCYEPQSAPVTVVSGTAAVQDFALAPSARWSISGTVTESGAGYPLEAAITLVGASDATSSNPATGEYGFEACSGTHTLQVSAAGHRAETREVTLEGHLVEDFALDRLPCTLLVDDDDGLAYQTYFAEALDALGESYDVRETATAGSPTAAELAGYGRVIWLTGDDAATTLTAGEQAALAAYLDGGGRLFVTGQDIGYDIGASSFYADYLHADYDSDDTNTLSLTGLEFLSGLALTIAGGDGAGNQQWPSDISPVNGGLAVLDYPGQHLYGGVAYQDDTYRVVYFSFGYEAISTQAHRNAVMDYTLDWLGGCESAPADLAASEVTAPVAHTYPGDGVVQQLLVHNAGATTRATVTATLPSDMTWVGALTASKGTAAHAGDRVTWTGFVVPGETITVTYAMTVNTCLPAGAPLVTVAQFADDAGGMVTRTLTTTVRNVAPMLPAFPSPAPGATDVPTETVLSWASSDANCDALTYAVAMGAAGAPRTVLVSAWPTLTLTMDSLGEDITYQWVVTATDGISATSGTVWEFTTVAPAPPIDPTRFLFLPLVIRTP
ncbi:MAG: hypothetical protein JXB35_12035 [Anaerolineae bacterium]|nr:hypothetical protein [Anaerolineae bacterium]